MIDNKEILNTFKDASPDNPIYGSFTLYYNDSDNDLGNGISSYSFRKPYNQDVVVAVTGVKGNILMGAVLDGGSYVKNDVFSEGMQKYDKFYKDVSSITVNPLSPTQELANAYADFNTKHATSSFNVNCALFEEYPSYSDWDKDHRFPMYDPIDDTEQTWTVPKGTKLSDGSEVRKIEDVEKWILENHPMYLMGYVITENVPSGTFASIPGPCSDYPTGMYETNDARIEYGKMRAEQLGVTFDEELARTELSAAILRDDELFESTSFEEEGDPAFEGVPYELDIPQEITDGNDVEMDDLPQF